MGTNLIFVICCVAAVFAAINREEIKANGVSSVLAPSH